MTYVMTYVYDFLFLFHSNARDANNIELLHVECTLQINFLLGQV